MTRIAIVGYFLQELLMRKWKSGNPMAIFYPMDREIRRSMDYAVETVKDIID